MRLNSSHARLSDAARRTALAVALGAAFLSTHSSFAASYTYEGQTPGTTGTPATGNFALGFNDGTTDYANPLSGLTTSLIFNGTSGDNYTATDNLGSGTFNFNNLTFANIGNITLAQGTGTTLTQGGATTIVLNNTGSLNFGLNINNNAFLTTFSGAGSGTFSGSITGTGGLTQSGTGTVTLSGANTYSGATTVNSGGGLKFVNNHSNGSTFADNGTLEFNVTTGTQTLAGGTLSGTGTFVKSGTGSLIFGGNGQTENVSMTGGLIDVQGGLLRNDYSNGNWTNNKSSLNVASGATVDMWDSPAGITVDALTGSGIVTHTSYGGGENFTVGVNNGSGAFSGTITNQTGFGLTLVKTGTGTETLTGTNSYTGGTTVSGGTLKFVDNTSTAPAIMWIMRI